MGSESHKALTDVARDRIELYVLGALRPDEVTSCEQHLETCECCREEWNRLKTVATDLVLMAPEAEPSPALKARVLARVQASQATLHLAGDREWIPTPVPGVEVVPLWSDAPNDRHTLLLRMAPGTSVPAHRHRDAEECFVIMGDVRDGEIEVGAGDYVRHEAGTEHTLHTRNGCVLLVNASDHDQRV